MGKSALVSFLFNEIVDGKHDNEEEHMYAAYVEAYGDIQDFGLGIFFKKIIRSLEEFRLLGKIASRCTQLIGQTIYETDKMYFSQLFQSWDPYENLDSTLQRLNDRTYAESFIESILNAIGLFYPDIQRRWSTIDPTFVKVLLYSQSATIHRIKALESLKSGKKFDDFFYASKGETLSLFHAIIELLVAIREKTVFCIFIDQLEELFELVDPKKISVKFFTLLLSLRQVPNISIVLSGNLESYNHLTNNIPGDMQQQLDQWHKYLHINRLADFEVVKIVYHQLNKFWQSVNMLSDVNLPYYPFSDETIRYLYAKHDQNLRSTLIGLHDIFNSFKDDQEVIDVSNPLKAIGNLNIIHDPLRLPRSIQEDLQKFLVSDEIQDKERSKIPEIAIYNLYQIVQFNENYISKLELTKKLSNSGRSPDIYYETGGNLEYSKLRRIAIEVKCYRAGVVVPKTDVEKTNELITKNDVDYVIWISNVPLHKESIENLSHEYRSKISRINPQTLEEQAYLYWAYIFEEAMQRAPTIKEAKTLLVKLGIPEIFINHPKSIIELEERNEQYAIKKPKIDINTSLDVLPKIQDDKSSDKIEYIKGVESPVVGLDLHKKIELFIESTLENYYNQKRKQIKKDQLYSDFLDLESINSDNLKEVEFLDYLERYVKSKPQFTSTAKLVKIKQLT